MYYTKKIFKLANKFKKLADDEDHTESNLPIDTSSFSNLCEQIMNLKWYLKQETIKYLPSDESRKKYSIMGEAKKDFNSTIWGYKQSLLHLVALRNQYLLLRNIPLKDVEIFSYYYDSFIKDKFNSKEKNIIIDLINKNNKNNIVLQVDKTFTDHPFDPNGHTLTTYQERESEADKLIENLITESKILLDKCEKSKEKFKQLYIDNKIIELKPIVDDEFKDAKEYLIKHWSESEPYRRLSAMINNPKFTPQVVFNNLKPTIVDLILNIKINYVYEPNKTAIGYYNPSKPNEINLNLSQEKYVKTECKIIIIHEISHAIFDYLYKNNYINYEKYQQLTRDPNSLYSTRLMIEEHDIKSGNQPYSSNQLTYAYDPNEQSSRVAVIRSALGLQNFITSSELITKLKDHGIDALLNNNNLALEIGSIRVKFSDLNWLIRPFLIQDNVVINNKNYEIFNLAGIVKMFNGIAVLPKSQQSVPV